MSKANGNLETNTTSDKISNKKEVPFYKKPNAYKKSGVMALIGCALMIAATILYWAILYVKTTATDFSGINMLMVCFKAIKGGISLHSIITILLMMLYYAAVVLLAIIGIKDNITRREIFIKYKKRIRFGLVFAVIILMILMTHLGAVGATVNQFEGLRDNWNMFIDNCKDSGVPGADSMSCIYAIGPGFICFIAGVILYIATIVFSFMLDTLNED